jgi:hypothetical protein
MAKPAPAPKRLKPGFYVEICDKGNTKGGIMVCSIGKKEMMQTVAAYEKNKYVIIWGEYADEKWVGEKIYP